jgi:hypothetical protein
MSFGFRAGKGGLEERVLLILLVASLPLVTPRIAESDAVQYFSYLHSVFFDGDLDFENEYTYFYFQDPEGRAEFKATFLDLETRTGLRINFGPSGTALLWSPFYLAAHLGALGARSVGIEVAADGLSAPYRWAVALGSAVYAMGGLLLSLRLARRWAPASAALAAVIALWWATPVAYYMYVAPGMSHAVSLFTAALFFFLWPWAEAGGVGRWAIWGASAGVMALVREQDGFLALAAPLAVVTLGRRLPVREKIARFSLFVLAAAAVFSPQILIYQILYGRPAPAPQVQNKMDWGSPHFLEVLFSPEHGLFFWSPVLLLFLAGAFFLWRKDRRAAFVLGGALVAEVYISGAVESWTTAGAFGARRFLGTTVLFAVFGAAMIDAARRWAPAAAAWATLAFLVLWNVSLMAQFGLGLMDRQRLVWRQVIRNQVIEMPRLLPAVASRYLRDRESLAGGRERKDDPP